MGAERQQCKHTWQRTQRTDSASADRRWSTRIKPATQRRWKLQNPQGKAATACSLAGSCAVNADGVRNDIIDAALGWFFFFSLDRRLSRTHKKRIYFIRVANGNVVFIYAKPWAQLDEVRGAQRFPDRLKFILELLRATQWMWMLLIHFISTNIELFLSALMQPFHSLYFWENVSRCDLKTQVLSHFISVELTH